MAAGNTIEGIGVPWCVGCERASWDPDAVVVTDNVYVLVDGVLVLVDLSKFPVCMQAVIASINRSPFPSHAVSIDHHDPTSSHNTSTGQVDYLGACFPGESCSGNK